MNSFARQLREQLQQQPHIDTIPYDDILAPPETVCCLDLNTLTEQELNNIQTTHIATVNQTGKFQGVCLWFACDFPADSRPPVTLGTSPEDLTTHWKQTLIILPTEIEVEEEDTIRYELTLSKVENTRRYEISMELLDSGSDVEMKELLVKAMLERYGEGDNN